MADLVKRLRAHASGHLPLGCTDERMLLEEAAAALEAEASKGERRGLERAAEVAASWRRIEPASRRTVADHFGVSENDKLVAIATADGIAEALRALIPEAPVRDGWRPIETAPKDGTAVIVAVPASEPSGFVVGEAYCNERRGGWWWANLSYDDDYADPIRQAPTHWRPLPPPPSQDREPDSQRGAK